VNILPADVFPLYAAQRRDAVQTGSIAKALAESFAEGTHRSLICLEFTNPAPFSRLATPRVCFRPPLE